MDFFFTQEQEQFRGEIREFLEEEIRKGIFEPFPNAWTERENEEFTRHVAAKGWIGMTWPREFGGQGKTYLDRLVLTEELMRYGAPIAQFISGDRQIGPSIIAYGTDEQKQYFLPKIIKGEISFALGMSEPEAGSDLGNVQTRAIEEKDCFLINGQKVWTSGASKADYIYAVIRTKFDPNISRYRSISEFLIHLNTPGITVKPLIDIAGGDRWCEVFFDDVRVPKTALIGKKDEGFYQIMSQLDYERSGIERVMGNYCLLVNLIDYVKKLRMVPEWKAVKTRQILANLLIKFEAGKLLTYRVA
jgi:alkylation response protein AidB-like acyl-CoA dehydrogenase